MVGPNHGMKPAMACAVAEAKAARRSRVSCREGHPFSVQHRVLEFLLLSQRGSLVVSQMNIQGIDYFNEITTQDHFVAKMVFNNNGAFIFSAKQEHRNAKLPNMSYEDNYKGNALAAMLEPGTIEIRYHEGFPDEEVAAIVGRLLKQESLAVMRSWKVTYQGRDISTSQHGI